MPGIVLGTEDTPVGWGWGVGGGEAKSIPECSQGSHIF